MDQLILSPEQIERIKTLYLSRTKLHHISEKTGINLNKVKKTIYSPKWGISRARVAERSAKSKQTIPSVTQSSPSSLPVDIRNRILVLTNFGYSPGDISQDLGIKPSQVRREIMHLTETDKIKKRV